MIATSAPSPKMKKKSEKKGLVMRANKHYLDIPWSCWVVVVDLILQCYFSWRIFAKFQPENL
jgi:hypothetical protein